MGTLPVFLGEAQRVDAVYTDVLFPTQKKIDVLFRFFFLIFKQTDFPLSPLLMVHMVLLQPTGKRVGQRPRSCFAAPKIYPREVIWRKK